MAEEKKPVVLDAGSDTFRAGIAEDHAPKSVFPTVVGRPRPGAEPPFDVVLKDTYVGNKGQDLRHLLAMDHPIKDGLVTNWEDMEVIWNSVLNDELQINPQEHLMMLNEPAQRDKPNREKMAQIMFEKYNVPGLFVALQPTLEMYSMGKLAALVVSSGEGRTSIIPHWDGYAQHAAAETLPVAGGALTQYMLKLLEGRDPNVKTADGCKVARDIKETMTYVPLDYNHAISNPPTDLQRDYQLPDGNVISVGVERIQCPELLFQPRLNDIQGEGLHQLVHKAIQKCESARWNSQYCDIVITGGSALFPGIDERLKKDVAALAPVGRAVNVNTHEKSSLYQAWIGGSILGSLGDMKQKWITRQEYQDGGNTTLHQKTENV